jgi:hypothetical protein
MFAYEAVKRIVTELERLVLNGVRIDRLQL